MTVKLHVAGPDKQADAYANDPRVETYIHANSAPSYSVTTADGQTYRVLHSGVFGWGLYQGPNLEMVQLPDGGLSDAHFAAGVDTAGGLIAALIGVPEPTSS